jgi:hypothetical protein
MNTQQFHAGVGQNGALKLDASFGSNLTPELVDYLRKVLEFLSLLNFRSIQQENLAKRTPLTLTWLLEVSMFQFWLESKCGILWGTGMRKFFELGSCIAD